MPYLVLFCKFNNKMLNLKVMLKIALTWHNFRIDEYLVQN